MSADNRSFLNDLQTCYGPFGRAKLISNHAGDISVFKNAHSILPLLKEKIDHLYVRIILNTILQWTGEIGDGALSTFYYINSIVHRVDDSIYSNHRNTIAAADFRDVIGITNCAFAANESAIAHHMLQAGLWRHATDLRSFIYDSCHTLVLPASNLDAANEVSDLMVKWLVPLHIRERGDSLSCHISSRCNVLMKNIDDYLLIQLVDAVRDANTLFRLRRDSCILRAHSHDFTAHDAASHAHRALCVERIASHTDADPESDGYEAATDLVSRTWLSLGADSASNQPVQDHVIEQLSATAGAERLRNELALLKALGVDVVVCANIVSNAGILEAFASSGIYLVRTNAPLHIALLFQRHITYIILK